MSYGLLRGAFRPAEQVSVLRALTRQRTMLLRTQARHVQHMQKALTQMNVQLANVIADVVVGVTGQKILRATVAYERDGQTLAQMKPLVQIRKGASRQASTRLPRACKATGGPSICLHSGKHWPGSISLVLKWPSATGRSRHSWADCRRTSARWKRARSTDTLGTHRSLICASNCSRCAVLT